MHVYEHVHMYVLHRSFSQGRRLDNYSTAHFCCPLLSWFAVELCANLGEQEQLTRYLQSVKNTWAARYLAVGGSLKSLMREWTDCEQEQTPFNSGLEFRATAI